MHVATNPDSSTGRGDQSPEYYHMAIFQKLNWKDPVLECRQDFEVLLNKEESE
jgi:hypothetical protein